MVGYTKFSSTKKSYLVVKTEDTISQVTSVHIDIDKRFFSKQRIGRGYINIFVPEREVYTLERNYRRNRSISGLRHLTVRVKSKGSKECTCVIYSISSDNATKSTGRENESLTLVKILPHGNSKNTDRPYIRTSRNVLEEEDLLRGSNKGASDVYGRHLSNNGGLLNSLSQSQEPRDLQQLYRRKSSLRKKDKAESSTSNSI